ncbi:MAG: DUF2934 domain-containing protein [Phycisphaerales bacterium]
MAATSTTTRRRAESGTAPDNPVAAPGRAAQPADRPAAKAHGSAHADPQPHATEIKPGATDRGVRHIHDGAIHRPTPEQIERRAYEIWLRRGGGDGNAAVDWLQAERELLAEGQSDQGDR